MKRILPALLFLACSAANAQFVTGQILTAAQLNAAFANVLATSGGTLTGPLTVQGSTTVANLTVNGTFTVPGGFSPGSLSPQAANSLLGNASGTTQAPGVVAVPTCSASGNALKWTSATGFTCGTGNALTANPLSQFAATTSAQLLGVISDETGTGSLVFGTSPTITGAAISGGTGSFTTLAASSTVSGSGFTSLLSPYLTTATAASTYATIAQATTALAATGGSINGVTVGATTPSTGAFTTLSATGLIAPSSTVGIKGTVAADNAQSGSIGEYATAAGGPAPQTTGVTQSVGSMSLTPGDWDVQATGVFTGSVANMSIAFIGVSTALNGIGPLGTYTEIVVPTVVNTLTFASPVVRISLSSTTLVYASGNVNVTTGTTTFQTVLRARRVR